MQIRLCLILAHRPRCLVPCSACMFAVVCRALYTDLLLQQSRQQSRREDRDHLSITVGVNLLHVLTKDMQATGEALIGARAFRVVFAGVSLPLAVAAVVYFINHRYSGTPLWNLRSVPGVHAAVWTLSLVSFFFLYPSTFNLLEVRSDPLRADC